MRGMNRLDHLVVAARDLDAGADYLRQTLGVDIPRGGRHQTMATHNCVMSLGGDTYLELIAIDPDGERPPHPRWFALDSAALRASIAERPRLITWVINTPDLAALAASTEFDIGLPTELSRDDLHWAFALPDDGRLLAHGLLPYCIQWHSSHPAARMADPGCRLQQLTLHHNRPEWLHQRLEQMDAATLVQIENIDADATPRLSAIIDSPNGVVTLD